MRLDVERSIRFREEMTDREKRDALDQGFRKYYPGAAPEEIHRIREEHVSNYYGKRRRYLPHPEKKGIFYKQPLYLQDVLEEIAKKYLIETKDDFSMELGGCLLPLLNGILGIGWFFAALIAFCMEEIGVLMLLFLIPVVFACWYHIKHNRKKKIMLPKIQQGAIYTQRWTVADMGWSYYDEGESSCVGWYLHLFQEDTGKKITYSISQYQYEAIREGETVYTLHLDKAKFDAAVYKKLDVGFWQKFDLDDPVYLVDADNWILDEPMKKMLGI